MYFFKYFFPTNWTIFKSLLNFCQTSQMQSFDECAGDVISKSPGTFKEGKQFMISPLNKNSLLFTQTQCLKTILLWPTENEIILFISTKGLFIPKQSCNCSSFLIEYKI